MLIDEAIMVDIKENKLYRDTKRNFNDNRLKRRKITRGHEKIEDTRESKHKTIV